MSSGIHTYPHLPCFKSPPIPGIQSSLYPRLSAEAHRAQIWAQHLIHHFSVDQLLNNPSNLPKETLKKLPKAVQNLVEDQHTPHVQSKQPPTHSQWIIQRPSFLPPSHSWQTLPDWFKCLDWPPSTTVPITPKLRSFAMRIYNSARLR